MQTIIIGHKNPDMDSICSALAYADLKKRLGMKDVTAGRAGNTNERIDFVLDRFGFDAPPFISDVSPKVADVMEKNVVSVPETATIYEAVSSIEQKRLRSLPVVNTVGHCKGLLSGAKIGRYLFPPREESSRTRVVVGFIEDMIRTFDGELIAGKLVPVEQEYLLVVAAMSAVSFQKRLASYRGSRVVLIVGDRLDVQISAIAETVAAIVVTGSFPIEREIIASAEAHNVMLISSRYDTATTLLLARGGVKVSQMVETNFDSVAPDMPLPKARDIAAASNTSILPVIDEHDVLTGILSKSDFLKPIRRQLILVDHNEMSQAVQGADLVPIIEVIDHHKLGGVRSDTPILFWNSPVGSTCTLVTQSFQTHGVEITPNVAGLLMAGIISDTLNLTSPTTTAVDKEILASLSQITGVAPGDLAEEIFSVGSPLRSLPADKVINADSKEYIENGHKFSVAQIEELSLSLLAKKQQSLIDELAKSRQERGLLFAALLVTDINTQVSVLLVCGADQYLNTIDFPRLGDNSWKLEGVVSRKKQLLPYLLQCLHSMEPVAAA